jgi:DNA polymerase V
MHFGSTDVPSPGALAGPLSSSPPLSDAFTALAAGIPLPLRDDLPPLPCPLAAEAVAAGFPSPADDYVESRIDLNVELIPRPLSTFFMRVRGDAMRGDGIVDGDLLVIDRSVDPRAGMVVVAIHEGAFVLRRLRRRGDRLWLMASDDGASPSLPLDVGSGSGAEIWGVAIHAVHHLAGAPSRRY